MSKRGKAKDLYGAGIRRSEYDDGIIRNNQRSDLRFKNEMQYQDRAQKVIMKELGKESMLLQTKLENDRKTIALGLFGSKIGLSSSTPRKQPSNGPIASAGSNQNAYRPSLRTQNSRNELNVVQQKFPWDREVSGRDSGFGKDNSPINQPNTSPLLRTKFRSSSSSAYPSSRAQSDDFLASILDEAMNAELMYSQSQELTKTPLPQTTTKTPHSARRKSKTPRNSAVTSRSDARYSSFGVMHESGYE